MAKFFLFLVLALPAFAQQFVVVDAQNTVVGVSFSATAPTTDTTCVFVGPQEANQWVDHGMDELGRATLRLFGGRLVDAPPAYAVGVMQTAALQSVLPAIRQVLQSIREVTDWQADADLTAFQDRKAELATLQSKLADLKQALAGKRIPTRTLDP